jgi:hypothetical protein
MSYFAKVVDNVVVQTIKADSGYMANAFVDDSPGRWVEFDKVSNRAAIGYTYDKTNNKFYPPKPYNSWVYDEELKSWLAPVSYPDDEENKYEWNENEQQWIQV